MGGVLILRHALRWDTEAMLRHNLPADGDHRLP